MMAVGRVRVGVRVRVRDGMEAEEGEKDVVRMVRDAGRNA